MLRFRKYLFVFLLGVLFLPLLESNLHLTTIPRLSGAYNLADDTGFTYEGWFSGKYQAHKEKFARDTFGFRSLFIRANNQLDYSLFHKAGNGNFIIGRNNNIFPEWYLRSFTGGDFSGSKLLKSKFEKLKYLQDTLAKLNKTFLIVIAPSKDFFNPEDIPSTYKKADSSNYEAGLKYLKISGLNYIDLNKYFIEQKNKTKYPLFYKYGSHWSAYGACLAGDSIITTLEKLRNCKIPHPNWRANIVWEEASNDELELEDDLNLIFPLKHDLVGHPKLTASKDSGKKPSILFIGDSYFWALRDHYNIWDCFSTGLFDYYFSAIYPKSGPVPNFVLKDAIAGSDIVVVEFTEANMGDLGFGFPDAVCRVMHLHEDQQSIKRDRILEMRNKIKSQPEWMKAILEKARQRNISVDSMVTVDATYMVEHQN